MTRLASFLLGLYRREPARTNAFVAALVVPLIVRLGLGVTDADVLTAVTVVLPLVVAELTRRLVVPVEKLRPGGTVAAEIADHIAASLEAQGIVLGREYPKHPSVNVPKDKA